MQSALAGGRLSLTNTLEKNRCDRQCTSKQRRTLSTDVEKRMITKMIIVLKGIIVLAEALVSLLELIREFID